MQRGSRLDEQDILASRERKFEDCVSPARKSARAPEQERRKARRRRSFARRRTVAAPELVEPGRRNRLVVDHGPVRRVKVDDKRPAAMRTVSGTRTNRSREARSRAEGRTWSAISSRRTRSARRLDGIEGRRAVSRRMDGRRECRPPIHACVDPTPTYSHQALMSRPVHDGKGTHNPVATDQVCRLSMHVEQIWKAVRCEPVL